MILQSLQKIFSKNINKNEVHQPSRSIQSQMQIWRCYLNWPFKKKALSISSILSLAAAAAKPPPSGYANVYALAGCVQANSPVGQPITNLRKVDLALNKCVDVDPFFSFQGGVTVGCPATTQRAIVIAFLGRNCGDDVSPVSTAPPADGSPGSCEEVTVGSNTDAPKISGKSFVFTCVPKV